MTSFIAGDNGLELRGDAFSDYDIGDQKKIDATIRHLPAVVEAARKYAERAAQMAGGNFGVTVQNESGTTRPRAYAHPINNEGIHEELSQAVLLKAGLSLATGDKK